MSMNKLIIFNGILNMLRIISNIIIRRIPSKVKLRSNDDQE
jgi:hypothetical protein